MRSIPLRIQVVGAGLPLCTPPAGGLEQAGSKPVPRIGGIVRDLQAQVGPGPARPRPGDAPRGRDPGRGIDALRARRD